MPGLRLFREILRNSLLHRMRDAERVELMNLAQLFRELRRRDAVAHSQPGGMQRLAEREHRKTALAQLRVREHARMLATVVRDVLVNFV